MAKTFANTEINLQSIIEGAVRNWINGNRKDALNAVLYDYGHSHVAAYLAVKITQQLPIEDAKKFTNRLEEMAIELVGPL